MANKLDFSVSQAIMDCLFHSILPFFWDAYSVQHRDKQPSKAELISNCFSRSDRASHLWHGVSHELSSIRSPSQTIHYHIYSCIFHLFSLHPQNCFQLRCKLSFKDSHFHFVTEKQGSIPGKTMSSK